MRRIYTEVLVELKTYLKKLKLEVLVELKTYLK